MSRKRDGSVLDDTFSADELLEEDGKLTPEDVLTVIPSILHIVFTTKWETLHNVMKKCIRSNCNHVAVCAANL